MTIRPDPSLMGYDERHEYYRELADEAKMRHKYDQPPSESDDDAQDLHLGSGD